MTRRSALNTAFSYDEIRPVAGLDGVTLFDYADSDFRNFWKRSANRILDELEGKIVRRSVQRTDGWFLDLGAGYGRLTPQYAGVNPRVVLVDYSLKSLGIASEFHRVPGIYFVAADGYRLPFKNGVFGGGICVRTFHHMERPRKFLVELRRVVDTEAQLLLTYTNSRSLLRLLRHGLERDRRAGHRLLGPAVYGTTTPHFRRLARLSGFTCRHAAGAGLLHQLDVGTDLLERLSRTRPCVYSMLAGVESVSDALLGPLRLAFFQFVVLTARTGPAFESRREVPQAFIEILRCPRCGGGEVQETSRGVRCSSCGRLYPLVGRVLDFRL